MIIQIPRKHDADPLADDPLLAEIELPPTQSEWRTILQRLIHGHAVREEELRNQIVDKTIDCQTYRVLALELFEVVRRLTLTIHRLRESSARLVAELRGRSK